MGPTCSQCQDDYKYNSETGECILWETCQEDTCNGHGICSIDQKTGLAKCSCDSGFTDDEDGNHCAACINENQVYPYCTMKTKDSLKTSACRGVSKGLVPRYMKDSASLWKDKVGDTQEFVRTYCVKDPSRVEKLDLPVVGEATIIKIFFKTLEGLKTKAKIVDSADQILFETKKSYQWGSFTAILTPDEDSDGELIPEKAFIIFEYSSEDSDFNGAKLDVVISMTPYSEVLENSKCDQVKKTEVTGNLNKLDNQMFDIYEFDLDHAISIDERIIIENQKLKVRFKNTGNAQTNDLEGSLLVYVHYNHAAVTINSKLLKNNGATSTFVKYGISEAFEPELDTESSLAQLSNMLGVTISDKFYTESGAYYEADFIISDKFLSLFEEDAINSKLCFPVNLVVEYVPPRARPEESLPSSEDDIAENVANIQFVSPPKLKRIPIKKYHNVTIEITLDQSLTEAYPDLDPTSTLSGTLISQMCALENADSTSDELDFLYIDFDNTMYKTNTIMPVEYEVSDDYKKINLEFPTFQAYENTCYRLVCRADPSVVQGNYYDLKKLAGIETQYCFGNEGKNVANKECEKCNPLGTVSCGSKGQCICAHPYVGDTCDQCDSGYELSTSLGKLNHIFSIVLIYFYSRWIS